MSDVENEFDQLRRKDHVPVFKRQLKMSFSSGHEVRPINDLFHPDDCIRLVVSFMVVLAFVFR
jgi:hypothetical protein